MRVKTRLSSRLLARTLAPKEIEGVGNFTGGGRLPSNCRSCLSGFSLTDTQANLQRNRNLKAFTCTVDVQKEWSDSNLVTVGKCFCLFKCDQVAIQSS